MTILVCDLETGINNVGDDAVGKDIGSPHSPNNDVVMAGIRVYPGGSIVGNLSSYGSYGLSGVEEFADWLREHTKEEPAEILRFVGHNFKFDMLYLFRHPTIRQLFTDSGVSNPIYLWDTMIAEYVLTGQRVQFASLDYLAKKYGGTLKNDRIKEYWEAGVRTEDIPKDELSDYLEGDIENTALIAEAQAKKAHKYSVTDTVYLDSGASIATTLMELNGMHFDVEEAKLHEKTCEKNLEVAEDAIRVILTKEFPDLPVEVVESINIGSTQQLSALLFGGEIKHKERRLVGKYKNGKDKYKIVEESHPLEFGFFPPSMAEKTKKPGVYKTDDATLTKISQKLTRGTYADKLLSSVLHYRKLKKDLTTYFKGYSELAWPHDSCIHGSLNHTVTVTGRLSSSKPNMQNLTGDSSDIKKCFKSRFPGGSIVEFDYSQIEVVVQAYLSGDEQMQDDIRNGVDFHCKRLAEKEQLSYGYVYRAVHIEKDPQFIAKRKKCKQFSFQRAYGAGAPAIAAATGMTVAEVKAMIEDEERMYPKVVEMQERWIDEVTRNRVPTGNSEGVVGRGFLSSVTGRNYVFDQYYEEGDRQPRFKKTQIINYPIQGLAGEILKLALDSLRGSGLLEGPGVVPINTVHDAIIFDVREFDHEWANKVCEVMKEATTHLLPDWDLPIGVDVEIGPSWGEMGDLRNIAI